jgi:heptosyltransferase-2/heptosyltransferase-3
MSHDQRPATGLLPRMPRWSFALRRGLRLALLRLMGRLCRWLAPPPPDEDTPPQRILIIKPDHLGDMLLATPALHLLRQQHPDAHIVVLAGPWAAGMLDRNPDVDAVLTLPFPGFARGAARRSPLWPYWLLWRTALLLRAGQFDTALLLRDDHWWGAALAALAGIPRRVGHAVPENRPFLTTALPWQSSEHVTLQALAVVHSPVAEFPLLPDLTLRYAPAATDHAWAAAWLAQHIRPGERLLIIHPGTGGAAKLWPAERWAATANQLVADDPRVRLLLTGGPGEEALVQAVAHQIDQEPPLLLVGATSVGQLAALLARATLVLGVDSGPLHLAVSQGAPTVHLFGASDADRFGPWGDPERHVVLRSGLWCSPCGVFAACPRATDPPECMLTLEVAEVVAVARQLLD